MGKQVSAEAFSPSASVSRSAVYEQIVERINALLASGELSPGDRLPPERRLAEVFGVSRNSVREAIRVLSQRGILESRPGSGTYVADESPSELVAGLADSMAEGRRRLREVIEVRLILEPRIAAMAARQAGAGDMTALRDILEAQRREIDAGGTGGRFDEAFHAWLAAMCRNVMLKELVERMHGLLGECRDEELVSLPRRKASLAAHEAILKAVAAGDSERAERLMYGHVLRIAEMLFPDEEFLGPAQCGDAREFTTHTDDGE